MSFLRVGQVWTRTTAITCKKCGDVVWSASTKMNGPKPRETVLKKPTGECKDCFSKSVSRGFFGPASFAQVDDNGTYNPEYDDYVMQEERREQFGW